MSDTKDGSSAGQKSAEHPFLAYGLDPLDFAEGANMGHTYVVRFRAAPDTPARTEITEAFVAALKKAPVEITPERWQWQDEWVLFSVGEIHEDDEDDFSYTGYFWDVCKALMRVHELAPITEATYLNSKEPNPESEWEAWTLKTQTAPTKWPFGNVSLMFDA